MVSSTFSKRKFLDESPVAKEVFFLSNGLCIPEQNILYLIKESWSKHSSTTLSNKNWCAFSGNLICDKKKTENSNFSKNGNSYRNSYRDDQKIKYGQYMMLWSMYNIEYGPINIKKKAGNAVPEVAIRHQPRSATGRLINALCSLINAH